MHCLPRLARLTRLLANMGDTSPSWCFEQLGGDASPTPLQDKKKIIIAPPKENLAYSVRRLAFAIKITFVVSVIPIT